MSLKLLERQQRKKEELQQTAKRVVSVGSNPTSSRGPSQQPQPPQQQPQQPQYDSYGREIRPSSAPSFSSSSNNRSYTADPFPSYSGRSQPTYRPRQYDQPPPQPRSSSTYGSPSRPYDYQPPPPPPPRAQPESYYRASPSSARAPYAASAPQPFSESPSLRPSAASAPPPTFSSSADNLGSGGSLAAWSRPALESRVLTLERLLAESAARPALPSSSSQVTDRELSDHLTVTVRKNRELRAELETCKASLTNLLAEREALLNKLNSDNDALQQLLEEAQRGKDALSKCISQLSMEKLELKHQLEQALEYVEQARENGGITAAAAAAPVLYEELSSSVDEVSVINQGLRESMQAMKLKEEQEARNNSRLNISAISTNRMFDDDDDDEE